MAMERDAIRLADLDPWSPTSYIPVYGFWCGPNWSAGERGGEKSRAQLIESPVLTRIGIDGVTPGISPVDSFCKDHDIAYFDAQGQPDEAMKKLEADLVLMARLDQLDFDQLPAVERLYARLMSFVFFEKIICVDLPNASSEWMGSRILELAKSFERLFQKIDGLTYIDQFGTKMTGVALDGKVGGLAYQMYWVTDRQADGSSRMWSYYKDAFEEAHGVSSIINEEIIGESLKEIIVMRDGSVSEQVGDSEPITLITPGYHPAPELGAASNNPLASYESGQLFSGWGLGTPQAGLGGGAYDPYVPFSTTVPPGGQDADAPVLTESPALSTPAGSGTRYFAEVVDTPGPGDLMGQPSPPIQVVGDAPMDAWMPSPWDPDPFGCFSWEGSPEFDDCWGLYSLSFFSVSEPGPTTELEFVEAQSGERGSIADSIYRHDLHNEQEADDLVYAPVLGLFSSPHPPDLAVGQDIY